MRTLRQLEKERLEKPQQDGFLGGWRKMLLVAFLAVVGLFGYLYYFTGLIRSHGESHHAAVAPLRKSLPHKALPMAAASTSVRPVASDIPLTPSLVKPGEPTHKGDQTLPGKAAQEMKPGGGTPLVAKKSLPEAPRPAVTAPLPVVGATKPAPFPIPATKATVKSAQAPPVGVKPQSQKAAAPAIVPVKPVATSAPAVGGSKKRYALRCGPFAGERELASARALLKKGGLESKVSPGPKRPTRMYRLHVAEFKDAAAAAAERKKLLEAAPDAFVLPHGAVYELIAGSYHEEGGGKLEQERLSAWGVTVELTQVVTPVATRQLTAGSFPTREAAALSAERLKNAGISCSIVQRR